MKNRPSVFPRRVLIDTSAYFAFADDGDSNYAESKAIFAALARDRSSLFTTNFILAETHALLLARIGRSIAARFLQQMRQSSTTIVRVSKQDEDRACAIIFRQDDKAFSLTDAISFAVMERLNITHALTFDRHFTQYGLRVLTTGQL